MFYSNYVNLMHIHQLDNQKSICVNRQIFLPNGSSISPTRLKNQNKFLNVAIPQGWNLSFFLLRHIFSYITKWRTGILATKSCTFFKWLDDRQFSVLFLSREGFGSSLVDSNQLLSNTSLFQQFNQLFITTYNIAPLAVIDCRNDTPMIPT